MDSNEVRYPDVTVQLTGEDSNAFMVIGLVARGIRKVHGAEAAAEWSREAMDSESYDDLLQLALSTVNVE